MQVKEEKQEQKSAEKLEQKKAEKVDNKSQAADEESKRIDTAQLLLALVKAIPDTESTQNPNSKTVPQ